MIFLPVGLLEPGMVIARNVPSHNPLIPLLVTGQKLTEASIHTIVDRGIIGLHIEHEYSDDLQTEEILNPQQKQEMLSDIQREFQKVETGRATPNYKLIGKMAEDIVMSVLQRDQVLCNVMDIRDYDTYTYSHSLYVGMMSVALGAQLELPPNRLTDLASAGLLHDIGKLDIPSQIINKAGALTSEEFTLIKEHPMRAIKRMRHVSGLRDNVIRGVGAHHEYFDGTGYPLGIAGARIPLYGRILAIADVYDALGSNRSYRAAWSPARIIDYITSRSGIQFDPELLTSFLNAITAFPVGTLVKLSNNSIGIVIKNHKGFTLRPTVRLLSPEETRGKEIDLSIQDLHLTVLDSVSNPADISGLKLKSK